MEFDTSNIVNKIDSSSSKENKFINQNLSITLESESFIENPDSSNGIVLHSDPCISKYSCLLDNTRSKFAQEFEHPIGSPFEDFGCIDNIENFSTFEKADNLVEFNSFIYDDINYNKSPNARILNSTDLKHSEELSPFNCTSFLLNDSDKFGTSEDILEYQKGICVKDHFTDYITPETVLEEISKESMPSINQSYLDLEELLKSPETADIIAPNFIIDHPGSKTCDNIVTDKIDNYKKPDTLDMGIENTWSEDDCFAVPTPPNFAIPLPPPNDNTFDDFSNCTPFEGPENEPYTSNLDAFFSSHEPETDIDDVTADPGVCGLRNLGNTCFMGAGVQCLVATDALVKFFLRKSSDLNLDENSLTIEFSSLIRKMWSGQYSVVHPLKFKKALGDLCPQFKDSSQHDCQEFLALLLDALHQQLLSIPKESSLKKGFIDLLMDVDDIPQSSSVDTNKSVAVFPNENDVLDASLTTFQKNESKKCNEKNELFKNELTESVGTLVPKMVNETSDIAEKDNSNNVATNLDIEDILKEAKTSNVNVLVNDLEANNEIRFDSEKFPKMERRIDGAHTNIFNLYENNTNGKRGKNTVTSFNSAVQFKERLDLKRIKMNDLNNKNYVTKQPEKNIRMENERKLKILNVNVDKSSEAKLNTSHTNGMSVENDDDDTVSADDEDYDKNVIAASIVNGDASCSDEDDTMDIEGEEHWKKITSNNKSVIFDSFQGQFKNTVVCSACDFKSVTYEPFMYLSVPLPHAIEKQLCVTFVPASSIPPIQYLLTLNKQDEVRKIKHHLLQLTDSTSMYTNSLSKPLVIAEVLEYHIAKILDENHLIRYMDDVNRKIYVFEQLIIQAKEKTNDSKSDENDKMEAADMSYLNNPVSASCTICLEEQEAGIRRHRNCTCVLCEVCIKNSYQHYGDIFFKCPVCRLDIVPSIDLVPIEQFDMMKCSTRMLNIPVVYRMDTIGDGNNNQKKIQLFGHPGLLKLPNQIDSDELYDVVTTMHPYKQDFKILLVDGQGLHCSRCMYNEHCKGCIVVKSPGNKIVLRTDDTLAVSFAGTISEIREVHHPTMVLLRPHKTLTLNDCVQAFCQSEILDEFNPWYCPKCEKNQCATKTLCVRQFPNYLIVYLKRFVFHECTSIKLEDKVYFPLHGFSFNKNNTSTYDLYACVCHSGGVSVGHYVSYTQHPQTNEWHCFNDETVSKQKPQEEEYCNAYILFYKKRDVQNTKK